MAGLDLALLDFRGFGLTTPTEPRSAVILKIGMAEVAAIWEVKALTALPENNRSADLEKIRHFSRVGQIRTTLFTSLRQSNKM